MRYEAGHKEKTRERVLVEAAKAIRTHGPHRVAVADVMAKAGLTHGGFYAHFKSKDDLVAAGIGQMFEEAKGRLVLDAADLTASQRLASYIGFYLSPQHRDTRSASCPLPFLNADAPRLTAASRQRFADGVAHLEGQMARNLSELGRAEPDLEAGCVLAEMVGALALARAEPAPDRSDLILRRSREGLFTRLGLEAA